MPTTSHPVARKFYLLPFTFYLLPFTFYLLPFTFYLLPLIFNLSSLPCYHLSYLLELLLKLVTIK
eukprot:UN09934